MATGLIKSKQDLTPEQVKKGIEIPDEFKDAYERVVAAGMTIMFSKETSKQALSVLKGGREPLAQRLGRAVAGLVATLYKQSNNTLPPQVMIPAGVELLIQAADFLRRSGMEKVDNQVIGDAMDVMITSILQGAGLSVEKISGFIEQNQGGGTPPPAQPQPMGA
jgi:hypothetical protein